MRRAAVFCFLLMPLCVPVHAHLNHVQFATVEESGGKLVVRYRMSADMFMSNLDLLIKSGEAPNEILTKTIDVMIGTYFKKHLMLDADGVRRAAESVKYSLDEKNGDWVADFVFAAEGKKLTLVCDAFLENNPNTQTLARINWRGEQAVFHFRKGNVEHGLGEAIVVADERRSVRGLVSEICEGMAAGLRAHGRQIFAIGAILFARMHYKFKVKSWIISAIAVMCTIDPTDTDDYSFFYFASASAAFVAVVVTAERLIPQHKGVQK